MNVSRRGFLAGLAASGVAAKMPLAARTRGGGAPGSCPFRLAVINDEISPDFDHACQVASQDFGLKWIELRSMWNKNVTALNEKEIADAVKILEKYNLRVTDIASPLFKTDWPGAPRSQYSPKNDSFGANFTFDQQKEILEKSIALAKQFKTDRIRCFDFWRLDDQVPYREAINAKLLEASDIAGSRGLLLVLENEFECNTATGRESARTLASVNTPYLKLNWDPGNAVARGELDAFPAGFALIPKDRIGHCHVKCAVAKPGTKSGFEWAAVGQGIPDWVAQFRALRQAGYRDAVSLETHWRGAGTPEASTRISWAGMKEALEKSNA